MRNNYAQLQLSSYYSLFFTKQKNPFIIINHANKNHRFSFIFLTAYVTYLVYYYAFMYIIMIINKKERKKIDKR